MKLVRSVQSLIFLIVIIGVVLYTFTPINDYITDSKKDAEKYKEELGKRVIIGSDTLVILDYDFMSDTYSLENRKKVGRAALKNLEVLSGYESEYPW